jgi:uncharacterized protein
VFCGERRPRPSDGALPAMQDWAAMLAIESPTVLSALNPRVLHLILFATEQCNFRCTYCYEDFKVGVMRPEVTSGVKALVANRISDLAALQISWFGGEPLLAKHVIYDVGAFLQSECYRYSVPFTSNMTTNGALLNVETAERLAGIGITDYQISLDGDSAVHNATRKYASGKGSFQVIWKNLTAIRDRKTLPFSITLRIHYSPDTWRELVPLIDKINEAFSDDERFKVYFKSVERLGGANDSQIRTFTAEAKHEVENILRAQLAKPSMAFRLDERGAYVCYASKANSMAIRANGAINKCTVALNDELNAVGWLRANGSVEINQTRFRRWLTGLETLEPLMLACPYGQLEPGVKTEEVRETLSLL